MFESPEISPTRQKFRHDDDPGPCPGCSNLVRCALKLIACEAFAGFVAHEKQWESHSRVPLAEIFRAVYG